MSILLARVVAGGSQFWENVFEELGIPEIGKPKLEIQLGVKYTIFKKKKLIFPMFSF